ncbi:MAG: hypothetical protein ABII64_03090 [Elusimicrobiota bacterium]
MYNKCMFRISKENSFKLLWLTLFGIAFGYVEAAVVVYLRALFYPGGFNIPLTLGFPFIYFGTTPFLQPVSHNILLAETGREAATILMLASVAFLSGKTLKQKLAFFLLPFAVWDIFYYVFLKVLIGWPASLSTLDVLFLIPVPWISPVWLPLSASLLIIFCSLYLLSKEK